MISIKNVGIVLILAAIFYQIADATLVSQATRGSWWRGNVKLESEVLRAKIYSAYLDIEDEFVLSPIAWTGAPQDSQRTTLEITGSFTLPQGSVIVGALLWNGSEILKAKLKPSGIARSQYDSIVDRQTSPPPAPRDPVIIEQTGANTYNLSVYPVTWDGSRKMRIRYLVIHGFDAGGFATTLASAGYLFGTAQVPSSFQLDIQSGCAIQSVKLEKDGAVFNKNLPVTVIGQYGSPYTIHSTAFSTPLILSTAFPDGEWQGDYILYKSDVPESLLVNAGLRMEVVFLWKWIEYGSFVNWSYGSKSVSEYGNMAIYQAYSIRAAAEDIVQGPAKVGMVLDKGDSNHMVFPLGDRSSRSFDSLYDFLGQFNSNYVLSTIAGDEFSTPGSFNSAVFREKYAKEFSVSIQKAYSLYSPSQKIVKHLVIVTVGPKLTSETPQSDFRYYIEPAYFQGITVTSYGNNVWMETGYWPGVPLFRFTADRTLQTQGYLAYYFTVPAFRTANFSVTVRSRSKNYNYDLVSGYTGNNKPAFPSFSFAGHSGSAWDSTVQWSAVDQNGDVIASYDQKPTMIKAASDTGFVKVWAGFPGAFSEVYTQGGFGAIYGVVSTEYSLLALESDTLGDSLRTVFSDSGVPMLADSEIYVLSGEPAVESRAAARYGLSLSVQPNPFNPATTIIFNLPEKCFVTLKIYDISGREIALLANRVFDRGMHRLTFSGDKLPTGIFICKLIAGGKVLIKPMMLVK